MHILLDTQPETRVLPRQAAIWPLAAITAAALIGLGVSTSASADLPDSGDVVPRVLTTVNQAV